MLLGLLRHIFYHTEKFLLILNKMICWFARFGTYSIRPISVDLVMDATIRTSYEVVNVKAMLGVPRCRRFRPMDLPIAYRTPYLDELVPKWAVFQLPVDRFWTLFHTTVL